MPPRKSLVLVYTKQAFLSSFLWEKLKRCIKGSNIEVKNVYKKFKILKLAGECFKKYMDRAQI